MSETNRNAPGKSTEEQVERQQEIHGSEVLGYRGEGREERSGQNSPRDITSMDDLADNRPEQTS